MTTQTTKTRRIRRTVKGSEASIASRLAQLAKGWDAKETADAAMDAAFTSYAASELTLGASGYATVPTVDRGNEYGSETAGILALLADSQHGAGFSRKALQSREDAALVSGFLTDDRIAEIVDWSDETDATDCRDCARVASYATKCRSHARSA